MTGSRALLSQQIFDEIEARIVGRTYPPGSHLAEDEIAAQLGVSRTPVREAFRMLSRAGWIEIQPHSGAYVRNPTIEEVRQVFEVRLTLDERAARLAARNITLPELDELKKLIDRGWRALEKGDTRQMTILNTAFHSLVAKSSRNQILARMLEELAKQIQWLFSAVATSRGELSWQEHQGIYTALKEGNADRAEQLTSQHSQKTQEAFFMQFLSMSSDGSFSRAEQH
jgi:DNA-binding GntR family transcriptional regulator